MLFKIMALLWETGDISVRRISHSYRLVFSAWKALFPLLIIRFYIMDLNPHFQYKQGNRYILLNFSSYWLFSALYHKRLSCLKPINLIRRQVRGKRKLLRLFSEHQVVCLQPYEGLDHEINLELDSDRFES